MLDLLEKLWQNTPTFTACGKTMFCSGILQAEISCWESAKHYSWQSSILDEIQVYTTYTCVYLEALKFYGLSNESFHSSCAVLWVQWLWFKIMYHACYHTCTLMTSAYHIHAWRILSLFPSFCLCNLWCIWYVSRLNWSRFVDNCLYTWI